MLTFLRKIRRSLISSGSGKKYLLYASGEITLVVIGILIALQINNWNEYRKERIIEKTLLIEISESVHNNQNILTDGVERWHSTLDAIKVVTNVIDKQLPYADSLPKYFRNAHQNRGSLLNALDFSGYKALENKGYDILTNQKLRKEVVFLFEHELSNLANSNEQLDFDNSGFHYEYITRHFVLNEYQETPFNYQEILSDPYYYSILKRLEDSLNRKISRVNRYLVNNQSLLQLLEEEISE